MAMAIATGIAMATSFTNLQSAVAGQPLFFQASQIFGQLK